MYEYKLINETHTTNTSLASGMSYSMKVKVVREYINYTQFWLKTNHLCKLEYD